LIAQTLREFANENGIVILVAHRPGLLSIADQIVRVGNLALVAEISGDIGLHKDLNEVVPSGSRNW